MKESVFLMNVIINNQSSEKRWNRYKKDFVAIAERTKMILSLSQDYNASIIFVDPAMIHEINREYRHIDRPTDVISFALKDEEDTYEMMEGLDELGDIFINVQAVVDQAAEYGHSLRREVCFLFTHGLLHLLGYDHMEKDDEIIKCALQDVIVDAIVPKKVHK